MPSIDEAALERERQQALLALRIQDQVDAIMSERALAISDILPPDGRIFLHSP